MPGPWEDYGPASQPAATTGPWSDYAPDQSLKARTAAEGSYPMTDEGRRNAHVQPDAQSRQTRDPIYFGKDQLAPDPGTGTTHWTGGDDNHGELHINPNPGSPVSSENRHLLAHETVHDILGQVLSDQDLQKIHKKVKTGDLERAWNDYDNGGEPASNELPAHMIAYKPGDLNVSPAQRKVYVARFLQEVGKVDPQRAAQLKQIADRFPLQVSDQLPHPDDVQRITTQRAQQYAEAMTRPPAEVTAAAPVTPSPIEYLQALPRAAYGAYTEARGIVQENRGKPLVQFDKMLPKTTGKGVLRSASEFASSLTSPDNLALIGGTGGLAELAPALSKLIGMGFSAQNLWETILQTKEFSTAVKKGDWDSARGALTKAALSAGMAAAGVKGSLKGKAEESAPKPVKAKPAPKQEYTITGEPVRQPAAEPKTASTEAKKPKVAPKITQTSEKPNGNDRVVGAQPVEAAGGNREVRGAQPPLPQGNQPGALPELPGAGGSQPAGGEPGHPAGSPPADSAVRRVTGSADIPLTDEGRQHARELAAKVPADVQVFHADNERSAETARTVSPRAKVAPWADPMKLGIHEGKPLDAERAAINDRIVNRPDESPGVSPITGEKGDSFNEARHRLIGGVQDQAARMPEGGKVLNITSGRALQIIDAWAQKGQPANRQVDTAALTKEAEFQPGQVYHLEPDGLKPVDTPQPGQNFATHGATEWNGGAKPKPAAGSPAQAGPMAEPMANPKPPPAAHPDSPPPQVDRESGGPYLGSGLGALEPLFRQAKAEGDRLRASRNAALDAAKRAQGNAEEKHAGELIRHYYTEERDLWAGTANQQLEIVGRKLVPKLQDDEALSIAREFRHQPQQLQAFIDGSHPFLAEKGGRTEKLTRALPMLRNALRMIHGMTDKERQADQVETALAAETLREGLKVGNIGGSRWDPDVYVPHILNRKGEGEVAQMPSTRGSSVGKIGKFFGFGERRQDDYPTLVHAIADGIIPKTLKSTAAFTIHANEFAKSRATRLVENHMAELGLGKYTEPEFAPKGWERVAPHSNEFSKLIPFMRQIQPGSTEAAQEVALAKINALQSGQRYADLPQAQASAMVPDVARSHLYAPPFIVKALRPMTAPDMLAQEIPGFAAIRSGQRAMKQIILGLSGFHGLTETDMAKISMGPRAMYKALTTAREDPDALRNERDGIGHGLTTSISSKVIEAYRSLKPGTVPTRGQIVMAYTGGKHVMEAADMMTYQTFDVLQRKYKVWDYATHRDNWLADNPDATPTQEQAAKRGIASYTNGVYGGLHWENMGIPRAFVEVGRFFFLAPDWSGSNIALAKYALDAPLSIHEFRPRALGGSPLEGALTKEAVQARLARAFWAKQLMQGLIENQLLSKMLSGQWSPRPFQVYHGKDKDGKDVYQNAVFRGSSSDLISFVQKGPGVFLGSKAAPFFKGFVHQLTGRDDRGRDIANKNLDWLPKRLREVGTAVTDVSPIPIIVQSLERTLVGDDTDKYTWSERIMTLFGPPAQHVAPEGMESTPEGLKEKPYRESNDWWTQTLTNKPYQSERESPQP